MVTWLLLWQRWCHNQCAVISGSPRWQCTKKRSGCTMSLLTNQSPLLLYYTPCLKRVNNNSFIFSSLSTSEIFSVHRPHCRCIRRSLRFFVLIWVEASSFQSNISVKWWLMMFCKVAEKFTKQAVLKTWRCLYRRLQKWQVTGYGNDIVLMPYM